MKYLFISLLLLFSACSLQPSAEQIETLRMAESEAVKTNRKLLMEINGAVVELGKRPAHQRLLQMAQELIELRKEKGLVINSEEEIFELDQQKVEAYLEEVRKRLPDLPKDRSQLSLSPETIESKFDNYNSRIEKLMAAEQPLNDHYVLLNVLYFEKEMLMKIGRQLGHN
jgi:chromosome condensin MukBEF ATPase and DNA-binding subunit MukB